MMAAARMPLRSDPANNQFKPPSAHGRIWFSTWLLWRYDIVQKHRRATSGQPGRLGCMLQKAEPCCGNPSARRTAINHMECHNA